MTPLWRTFAGAVIGVTVGAALALSVPAAETPTTQATSTTTPALSDRAHTTPTGSMRDSVPTDTVPTKPVPPGAGAALVWTPGRLPDGLADDVSALPGVVRVIEVRVGQVLIARTSDNRGVVVDEPDPEYAIPAELAVVGASDLAYLAPDVALPDRGQAILGETSARVRRLGVGGRIELVDGTALTVVDVVADDVVGATEIVVTAGPAAVTTDPRYLVAVFEGSRASIEDQIRHLVPPATPMRFRGPGETPYLRHGDAVLPPALIKERFGEFAVSGGSPFSIEPGWVEEHLVTSEVPLIGTVTCHRLVMPLLVDAMRRVEALDPSLIDGDRFEGCWNPRRIGGSDDLSRHAWGVAVDLNYRPDDPDSPATVSPVVVEIMRSVGFTWGGEWLSPDPTHFEWSGSD